MIYRQNAMYTQDLTGGIRDVRDSARVATRNADEAPLPVHVGGALPVSVGGEPMLPRTV